MSKSSLADYADIERCYLRGIERGQRRPTVNTVFCLCEALQTDPVDFFRLVTAELARLESRAEAGEGAEPAGADARGRTHTAPGKGREGA